MVDLVRSREAKALRKSEVFIISPCGEGGCTGLRTFPNLRAYPLSCLAAPIIIALCSLYRPPIDPQYTRTYLPVRLQQELLQRVRTELRKSYNLQVYLLSYMVV